MDQRRERVEDPDLDVAALEADRVRQRVAVDRGPGDGRVHEPDVDVRQPGLPGDRPLGLAEGLALDAVDQLLELGLDDRLVGPLPLLLWVVVKPFTSSPAMPITTWLGSKPGHLLGLLERDRAVVDDRRDVGDGARLHVRQALAFATDAAHRARAPSSSISKTSALANSVPTSSAVQAARLGSPSRCQMRRQKATQPPVAPFVRTAREWPRGPPPAPRGALPFPGPSPAGRRPRPSIAGHGDADEVAGGEAARDEVVADRHEDLGLVGVEAERDDPGPERRRGRRVPRLEASRSSRTGRRAATRRTPGRDLLGACRELGGHRGRRSPPSRSRRRVSRSSSWSAAIRSGDARRPTGARRLRGTVQRLDALAEPARRPLSPVSASMRRMPGADAALAGDHEAADLAGRPAVRAAAQLEAVVLDPDRAHGLAVLLVEERVGATLDRLGHRHVLDGDGRSSRMMRADLVLDRALLVVGQRPVEREVEAQVVRRRRASRPGGPGRRRRCAARGAAGACPCGCASCARAARRRRPPRPSRRPGAGRGACRGGRSARRPASGCPRPRTARCRRPARGSRPGRRPARRPPRRTASRRGRPRPRRCPVSSSNSIPSRTIATTRPSAVVVS